MGDDGTLLRQELGEILRESFKKSEVLSDMVIIQHVTGATDSEVASMLGADDSDIYAWRDSCVPDEHTAKIKDIKRIVLAMHNRPRPGISVGDAFFQDQSRRGRRADFV